jgi:7,8-dihydropterin-6-yl-methyl-4-(beta-D-ribofuranosyl)aminobenzene 5'-phosphate synthase
MSIIRLVSGLLCLFSLYCTSSQAQMNTIVNIYDNRAPKNTPALVDWGFSVVIAYNGQKLLFDFGGRSGVLENNAKVFGEDIGQVDMAFLSHNHNDHIGGIDYVLNVNRDFKLYAPNEYYLGGDGGESDADDRFPRGLAYRHPKTSFVAQSTQIAPGMFAITTVSELTGKVSKYPPHDVVPEFEGMKELSLALKNADGSYTLVSGCSHSTIEQIVAETKRATGADVKLVVGGFHMGPYSDKQVEKMAHTLKDELGVTLVAPTHCTGDDAVEVFRNIYGKNCVEFMLGSKIEFE